MKDDYDEFNEPYLPARYKEVVRKKKQRRLLKKVGFAAVGVIAVIAAYVLISGAFAGPGQVAVIPPATPAPTVNPVQTTVAGPVITATRTAAPPATTVPLPATTPSVPVPVVTTETPEPVLTAMASALNSVTPTTAPQITGSQAESIAETAFPALPSGTMSVELASSPLFGQVWKYTLLADTTVEASGLIDAATGSVVTFNRTIHAGGRPQNPVLTMGNARTIADSTINNRNNGILSVNMSDGRYVPLSTQSGNVAGSYRFVYNRIIQDYPCDADGFVVSVDAVSGAITEYVQRWQTPDNAFMVVETPVVPKYDATYAVQAKAKSVYPASISTLRIISADRLWKDSHAPAVTPRPASIPLAWKVVFDDETIRAQGGAPSVAWVDTRTGEIIEMTYRH